MAEDRNLKRMPVVDKRQKSNMHPHGGRGDIIPPGFFLSISVSVAPETHRIGKVSSDSERVGAEF